MFEDAVMALIETVGSHPDMNASLGEALKRRGVDLDSEKAKMASDTDQVQERAVYERLEIINDELAIIRRLLGKPEACMAASEIMDVIRMSVDRVHSLYESLAFELRTASPRP